jgi:hypothetical protein
MLNWLNVLNLLPNLVDLAKTWINKKADVDLEKYKVNGQFDLTLIQARAAVATARAADVVDRWGRRLIIYPYGIWYSLVVYDSCFRNLLPAGWTWRVLALPPQLDYIGYAVIGYLLLSVAKR